MRVDIIVVDSVAALVPKAEIEGEMGDCHVGLQARLMSQALRKLTGCRQQGQHASVIFINQLREKIGVMFGNPETTTGGQCSEVLRLRASRHPPHPDLEERRRSGRATARASRWSRTRWPRRSSRAEFDMLYGEGISREGSVIDMAQQVGVVKKSGSWFTYEGDQLGQGREKVRQFLKDNPAITEEIENKVKAEFGLIGSADQFAEDGEAAAAAAVSEAAAADVAKDSKAAAAPAAKTTRAKAGTAKA